jgi:hypothetical protein
MRIVLSEPMKRPLGASVIFHLAVLTAGYISLPYWRDSLPPLESIIVVDMVELGEKTNVPPPKVAPEPKQEPAKTPPPPTPQAATPPPPPPPPPAPAQSAAATPAPAPPKEAVEPAPKAEQKAEPKPEPPKPAEAKPEPKPQVPAELAKAKPMKKPAPPDPFASVLKTVENLKQTQQQKPDEAKKAPPKAAPQESFEASIQKAVSSSKSNFNPNERISITDIDLVRSQIAQCWNPPAGAKDAGSLVTEIRVWMNQNGTVQKAEIQNTARVYADPYYRAMAETALRAVLNPRCQPFKLPPERYSDWSTMLLAFDPKEMF